MLRVSLSIFILITSLQAVDVPNISDALKEVRTPKIERKKEILPPLQSEDKEYKKVFEDGKKVKVKGFSLSGATHLDVNEIKKILKPYENSMLSFQEIQTIADMITQAYREKGYFVARAYIPLQSFETQNGVLKIAVVEGEYGIFTLENESFVKSSVLQENLDEIKQGGVISKGSLERVLLLINDMPGVIVNSTQIKAGNRVGSSDFIIGAKATERYNGYVIVDNYGSPYTGEHRVMAGVDINSPFAIGDSISVSALSSENLGLLNGRVAYDFPLNRDGLRAEVSYTKTTYELGGAYKQLDAVGFADSLVAQISYPYIRTNNENLNTYLKVAYNKMNDEIQAVNTVLEKDTIVATVGGDYVVKTIFNEQFAQFKVSPSITLGRLSFNEDEDTLNDNNGAQTNGQFSKVNLDIEGNILINDNVQWKNILRLQYALGNKNLNGSEDLSIGGTNGVKFYPNGEESAENGYILSTEFLYLLPTIKSIESSMGLFYDNGRVFMNNNYLNEESRTLQNIGVSYYASYKDFFVNSHLAYRVGAAEVLTEENYGSKFMVQAGWVF